MILSTQKPSRPFKFHSNRKPSDDTLSASLQDFRSKISEFVSRTRFGSNRAGLGKCLDLINAANSAFAKMTVQIDHPMTRWGEKLTDEFLGYTLSLLGLLNSVNSSLSQLARVRMSNIHALTLVQKSPSHASERLKKITKQDFSPNFKPENPMSSEDRPGSGKDRFLLDALSVLEKIEFLAMGFVLSGLCSDEKPYMEVRGCVGGFEDCLIKEVDSRFCKEMSGKLDEVKEVNRAVDLVVEVMCIDGVEELKLGLEALASLIHGIQNQANNLFSQVLGLRNKLLDNIRLTG